MLSNSLLISYEISYGSHYICPYKVSQIYFYFKFEELIIEQQLYGKGISLRHLKPDISKIIKRTKIICDTWSLLFGFFLSHALGDKQFKWSSSFSMLVVIISIFYHLAIILWATLIFLSQTPLKIRFLNKNFKIFG